MSGSGKRPADFVRVPLSTERTERIWQRLEASRRPRRVWPLLVAASLVTAVVVAVVARRPTASLARTEPVVRIEPDVATARVDGVALVDGSVLRPEHDAQTTVVAASGSEIRVRLDRGAVDLDVARVPGRLFVLEAMGVEVQADGAYLRASVAGEPAQLSLAVSAGDVAVRSPAGEHLASLREGQTWSLRAPGPSPVASAPARRPEPHVAPRVTASSHPTEAPPSAVALFAGADRARLDGHPADAARRLEQLCVTYPADARAGVAAFQLGRLRLRELGDPSGAAAWFRTALAHPSAAAYREDASADLVDALDRAGQTAACRQARDAFVAAHPASLRRAAVSERCRTSPIPSLTPPGGGADDGYPVRR